jgi:putative inorganic carbon (HCO3(-)) transporter
MLTLCVMLYIAAVYLRPGELVPALNGLPILDGLAALGLLLGFGSLMMRPRRILDQPHDLYFLGFYGILVASNPLNGYFAGLLGGFLYFAPVAFCYFLLRIGLSTVRHVRLMTNVLIVLTLFLAVNGLLQVYAGAGLGGVQAVETRAGARIQGTGIFSDANDLGMALVMVVPFCLSIVLGRSGFFARLFNVVALAVLILACYHTNSRGTILGLGVVFSIFAFRRFGLFTAATLTAVGLSAILLFGPSRTSNMSADEDSAQGRIQAWAAALVMFRGSPFWGVGFGAFDEHHERAAHNSFMHTLGELGILGALMQVGMFYWYFIGLRPALKALNGTESGASPPRADGRPRYRNGFNGHGRAAVAVPPDPPPAAAATQAVAQTPTAALRARLRAAAPPEIDRVLARDTARNISDCGVGVLTCVMFLSRQYTVTLFIPLALAACLASATSTLPRKEAASGMLHLARVPALTVALVAAFWVGVKVLVRY